MVKFTQLPGLAASVIINGREASELEDRDEIQVEHEDPDVADYQISRTHSVYIEAEDGKAFSIKMEVGAPLGHADMVYTKLIFEVFVDGIEAGKAFCGRPFFKNGGEKWNMQCSE